MRDEGLHVELVEETGECRDGQLNPIHCGKPAVWSGYVDYLVRCSGGVTRN